MRIWALKIVLAILIYGCLYFSLPSLEAWTTFWPDSLKSQQVQFLLPIIFSFIPLVINITAQFITGFRIEKDGRIVFTMNNGKENVATVDTIKREIVAPLTEQILSLKKELDDRPSRSTLTYTENQQKEAELRREIDRAKKEKEQLESLLDTLLKKLDGKDLTTTDHLYQKALTLFLHGQLDKALAVLNDKKLQAKENAGIDKQQLADLYLLKAEFLKAKLLFAEAGKYLEKAAELIPDWERCFETARFYLKHLMFQKTKKWYEKALALVETPRARAGILNNIANVQKLLHDYESARMGFEEALSIRRELAKMNSEAYSSDLAQTLNNLGELEYDVHEYVLARKFYEEALSIQRELIKINSEVYLLDLAGTLNNLGVLECDVYEYKSARNYYEEALSIRRELSKIKPDIYLFDLAKTMFSFANMQKNLNEYESARKGYEEVLSISLELAKSTQEVYLPDVAMTLNNLAILQKDMQEYDAARMGYEEALSIRRELSKSNREVYLPDVAMTLNNLANLQVAMQKYDASKKGYEEALSIRRELAKSNPEMYLPEVAQTLNNLALLQAAIQECDAAKKGYDEALSIFQELAKRNPEVWLPYVAGTLINLGLFHQITAEGKQADKQRSLDYLAEALKITLPYGDKLPYKEYADKAWKIANAWDLDAEELAAFYRRVGTPNVSA
jgi:tetratricopeptide (TPR) repeat protein